MSSWETEIISAKTDSEVSDPFSVTGTVTIVSANLGTESSGEGVGIQFYHDGSWYDLYLNGIVQEITKTHSMITLTSPGLFRAVKTTTANAVSVFLWKTEMVT